MSTITRTSRFRRLTAASSILAVAGAITLAAYSDHAEMETEFTTGTFGIAIDGNEGNPDAYSVAFDATDLVPGDTAETTVDLQNTGTITAAVGLATTTASAETPEARAFLDGLRGSYSVDGGDTWSEEVPLAELTTTEDLTLQGGASTPFSIRVHYLEGTGNEAQGAETSVNFRFEAEQFEPADVLPGQESPVITVDRSEYRVGDSMEVTIAGLVPLREYQLYFAGWSMWGGTFHSTADGTGVIFMDYEVPADLLNDGEVSIALSREGEQVGLHGTGAVVID